MGFDPFDVGVDEPIVSKGAIQFASFVCKIWNRCKGLSGVDYLNWHNGAL
jgi:hypothetical protein